MEQLLVEGIQEKHKDRQDGKSGYKHPVLEEVKEGDRLLMNTPDGTEEVLVTHVVYKKIKRQEKGVYVSWRGNVLFVENMKALHFLPQAIEETGGIYQFGMRPAGVK